ncbi:AMP-binding protein, partial [uncultured Abyssibacter sp.]|uniref:AMP-binding protein n=1 Tax=uncultured Abyssibacter sp. TaxID=2320202 RepID=UPI0032B28194
DTSDRMLSYLPLAPDIDCPSWDGIIATTEPLQGEPDRSLDDLATIVYTSGSTGQPKGVMQTFGSFKVCGTLLQELFPLDTSDRMLSYLPLAHVAERLVVENNSTYHGFHVFFAESLDTFLADLQRAQPTMFFSVPRLWTKFHLAVCDNLPLKKQKLLFRLPILGKKIKRAILTKLGLQHVRVAFTGAAPLPPSILAWYRSLGLDLLEAYGMSENFAYSHFTRPNDAKDGHIGPPNPGVECRIDPATGEIQVKSPAQMLGYFKAPDKTAECYTDDGYFKTGDMGEEDEAGRLRVTGRVKELFKTSKGKYVAPVPIENKLGNHPRVEVVCVAGANRPAPYAMVLLAEDTRQHLDEGQVDRDTISEELGSLLELVNPQLDAHERVQFLAIVNDVWDIENGFLTPTMKIRRNIIEKHYADHEDGWYAARSAVLWQSA